MKGLLHVLSLMLRHQALGVLPLLGPACEVLYLPGPCPLPVAAHDFSQSTRLVEEGRELARAFLGTLVPRGQGIHGHPHLHAVEMAAG